MSLLEEKIILKNLSVNPDYFVKVYPFLREELFAEKLSRLYFSYMKYYYEKYSKQPAPQVLAVFAENCKQLTDDEYTIMRDYVSFFKDTETYEYDWLVDKTSEWLQSRSYYEAIFEAVEKYEKGDLDGNLPDKINNALAISFDTNIGMEFSDAENRWDCYTSSEEKIPFLLNEFNEITKGGISRKTLSCFMSSRSGGFKSGTMCSLASDYLRQGYNVLYVTLEMAEDKILERIDANLLDVNIDDLVSLGKEQFISKVTQIEKKTQGRLVVKQFPTSMCHVGHIRYLLKELKLKKNFVPTIIFIDYLNLMISNRIKGHGATHEIVKAISEDLRGLAVESNTIMFSAVQSNRSGFTSGADLDMDNISESFASIFVMDLLLGLISTEEFDADNKILIKQIKNRYAATDVKNKFFVGCFKPKMKLFSIPNGTTYEQTNTADEAEDEMFKSRMKQKRIGEGFQFS